MVTWILVVEWIARLILLILVLLSVWSISIILNRRRTLKEMESDLDLQQIKDSSRTAVISAVQAKGPVGEIFAKSLKQPTAEAFAHSLNAQAIWMRSEMERGLPVLGTLGSTAPFIGLLGTVFGIIVAFGQLSSGQVDSLRVMFVLAEALILTAVGLAVAIPAVMANNYFSRKIVAQLRAMEAAKEIGLGLYSREEVERGVSGTR
jgi:biopolymer transport protein ExbB/TolQ